jgi:hypothetical protein
VTLVREVRQDASPEVLQENKLGEQSWPQSLFDRVPRLWTAILGWWLGMRLMTTIRFGYCRQCSLCHRDKVEILAKMYSRPEWFDFAEGSVEKNIKDVFR